MSKYEKTLIVTGIARSGMSLTMQMLDAGGFPVAGEWPAYEPYSLGKIPWDECRGKAVKVVDTHLQWPPRADSEAYDVILLYRNANEQAKSVIKMASLALRSDTNKRSDRRRIARSIQKDRARIHTWARRYRTLELFFEDLTEHPASTANKIMRFLKVSMAAERMTSTVVRRKPECLPHLLEIEQVRSNPQ